MLGSFEQIQKAFESNRIDGAWLISGAYGFGKKDFVRRACSLLLKQNITSLSTFHPNIKLIECGLTDESKKAIQKNILAGKAVNDDIKLEHRREITVDEIREGIQFLSLKGSSNEKRILIIYLADQMNENAQNALLKALEEPSDGCVLFLLSQNLGKLLPTIKSRCRHISLYPMDDSTLTQIISNEFPMIQDTATIIRLANGSLGLARDICEHDGITLYNRMTSLFLPIEQLSSESVHSFADELNQNPTAFRLFKIFLFDWLMIQIQVNAIVGPLLAENWLDLYYEINQLFIDVDRIYLDKKQVITTAFFKIAEVLHD